MAPQVSTMRHELAVQGRGDVPGRAKTPAELVKPPVERSANGHRPHRLRRRRRRNGIDPARDVGVEVIVDIRELEQLAARGVDPRPPGSHHVLAMEDELPDLDQAAAQAGLEALGGPGVQPRRGQQMQARRVDESITEVEAADRVLHRRQRLLNGDLHRRSGLGPGAGRPSVPNWTRLPLLTRKSTRAPSTIWPPSRTLKSTNQT